MSDNPLTLFRRDRMLARQADDPMAHVCVLATIDNQGRPQARTLVLREYGDDLALYINASSPKWREIAAGASIQTYWPSVELQYRMQVRMTPLPAKHVSESWQFRPTAPKRMDWLYQTYPQSSDIGKRPSLLQAFDESETPDPLVAPESAKGMLLHPMQIERLDLNQENGVHDRVRYTASTDGWSRTTLVP